MSTRLAYTHERTANHPVFFFTNFICVKRPIFPAHRSLDEIKFKTQSTVMPRYMAITVAIAKIQPVVNFMASSALRVLQTMQPCIFSQGLPSRLMSFDGRFVSLFQEQSCSTPNECFRCFLLCCVHKLHNSHIDLIYTLDKHSWHTPFDRTVPTTHTPVELVSKPSIPSVKNRSLATQKRDEEQIEQLAFERWPESVGLGDFYGFGIIAHIGPKSRPCTDKARPAFVGAPRAATRRSVRTRVACFTSARPHRLVMLTTASPTHRTVSADTSPRNPPH